MFMSNLMRPFMGENKKKHKYTTLRHKNSQVRVEKNVAYNL